MLTFLLSITDDEHKHILLHIYENYRSVMYKTAYSIVHNNHLTEDIVQASFERIINKMLLVKQVPCNGLRNYTVLIVRSVAINTISKEKKYQLKPDMDLEMMNKNDDINLENLVIKNEQVDIIRKCLNEIGEKYAHPMIFRYYYGYSDSETAELLGINSASTVRSLCHRGKKLIIEAMEKAGEHNE